MNKDIFIANGVVALIGGWVSAALGGWTLALQLLVVLLIADYLTGMVNGFFTRTLSSQVGFRGICKKMMILGFIAIAALIDGVLSTALFRDLAVFFYISNEGVSLLENTAKLGVPYPPQIKDALSQLGKMAERPQQPNLTPRKDE